MLPRREVATVAKYRARIAGATQSDRPTAVDGRGACLREAKKATRIMRNFVASPVGRSAARDKQLREIWREAELRGR
jgi:hypothetical protein